MSTRKTAKRDVPTFDDPLLDRRPEPLVPRGLVTEEEFKNEQADDFEETAREKFPLLFTYYGLKSGDWENLCRALARDFVPGFRRRYLSTRDYPDYIACAQRVGKFYRLLSGWKNSGHDDEDQELSAKEMALYELAESEEADLSLSTPVEVDLAKKRQDRKVRRAMNSLRDLFPNLSDDQIVEAMTQT